MRVPLSWLREFAPIDAAPEDIAATFSNLGLVVEGMEIIDPGLDGIVVARVLDLRPHPDADRVQLVDVDAGDGEARQIVCGAFNMTAGDLVPLATLGTVMPNGMEIGRRKMRGEWSNGMLCSAAELGLPEQDGEKGIFLLPSGTAAPGTPLRQALGLEPDVVYDLEVSPNRPDAMSVAGVARDLAAALGVEFLLPAFTTPVEADVERVPVTVTAADLCPRFTATVFEGVTIGPSPAWLARRLTLAGMRPINNVVDLSNYVMLELGQPNHAYDLDRLPGRGLGVRRARPGETLVTLDGIERRLEGDDCVIVDGEDRPVGIAGIMGGASSEISDATTTIVLEAAYFTPMAIARTGTRLGLYTEARARFERGVDPGVVDRAIDRFAALLAETAGGRRGPTVDVASPAYLPAPLPVAVRTARVNDVLGTSLTDADIARLLAPIGFSSSPAAAGVQTVTIPTWRPDSAREIDVIEEVGRLHGYGNIARSLPPGVRTGGGLTTYQRGRRRVRDILAGAGVSEAWTTTFLGPGDLERAGLPGDAVEVENPLDRSESLLRTSLIPGLLKAVRFNADRQAPDVRLFEIGHVFAPPAADAAVPLPDEREDLAVVVAGAGADAVLATRIWAVLAAALRLEGVRLEAALVAGLHPTRAARLVVAPTGQVLGAVGEIDPASLAAYGISGRVGVVLAAMEPLLAAPRRSSQARPVSRFPASDIDLAFVVADTVAAGDVAETLRAAGGELAESVTLFDVYRGPGVGEGRRSLAFHIRLRAMDHTLTEAEVAGARQAMIDAVVAAHGAELRA
ncbi:MAG TPA: phenylalanine--tRNA ligase subunit beta [Acidimicrobiales bacterium]|jgi:phenylalanyl-tRNA synthetase beta chain|nr:phenylalanine--tRNA ligase subunit beta [Acidimicrobiales bacterium]